MIFLFCAIFVLLMTCITGDSNVTTEESQCKVTDIDTHLKIASHLIEASRRKLPKDLEELCSKTTCERKAPSCQKETKSFNCDECEKCSAFVRRGESRNSSLSVKPIDCSDLYREGYLTDGEYDIWPQNKIFNGSLRVYCDMTTDGGGWTVIQRRGDFGNPEDYFYRDWITYKTGFGDLSKEFWLGNDNIFALTNQRSNQLRADLETWERNSSYVTYDQFWISDELCNYTLHLGSSYSGPAGDSLSFQKGKAFSTKDKDNDQYSGDHCAVRYKGAWWYKDCHHSNLNGLYLRTQGTLQTGVIWRSFSGIHYSLKDSIMKIRPMNFKTDVAL